MNITHISKLSMQCDLCDHDIFYFYFNGIGAYTICPVCMRLPRYSCGGNFKRSIFTWINPLRIISYDCLNYFKSRDNFI